MRSASPEQRMVPDDGCGASQSDTLIGAAAAADANGARNDTSDSLMNTVDAAMTMTVVTRSDGEAGPIVECGLIPSPTPGCPAPCCKNKKYT